MSAESEIQSLGDDGNTILGNHIPSNAALCLKITDPSVIPPSKTKKKKKLVLKYLSFSTKFVNTDFITAISVLHGRNPEHRNAVLRP
jgi:hypothetical protein